MPSYMIEDILSQVQKPGRYIGQEWNSSKKDFGKSDVKFALSFPDLYEVGMSNLGLRIIYNLLNGIEGVCCERFFSPGIDLEGILLSSGVELFSLESKKPLKEFDMIGFSLGYELTFTNVLNILKLGGIPLRARERDGSFPLVIAGGPCAANPEPMAEFIDAFVIGEAEEAVIEIISSFREMKGRLKEGRLDKEGLLRELSNIEGVYVPSLYEVKYFDDGRISGFSPKSSGTARKIKKRYIKDLNSSPFPVSWLVPYIEIVHDRITLEVMRGCPNACRFCQARNFYYPLRARKVDNLLGLACAAYKQTGYEEISFSGLSVSDYPFMEELLNGLLGFFKDKGVSVSLPSIKPRPHVAATASLIALTKKTGLTFAPEAATEKLRRVLNKDFQVPDFFRILEQSYLSGYQRVKLYFMIGLPSEQPQDLDAIVEFAKEVSELRKKINVPGGSGRNGAAQVNISINTLIPKPHTPFQWLKMHEGRSIADKTAYLKGRLRNKRIKLNFHNPEMSILEGVLSRGDRRLAEVIEHAFNNGARFDAWEDHFVFRRWQEAFFACGIDMGFYLKEKSADDILPWDFLDMGVGKEELLREFNKLVAVK